MTSPINEELGHRSDLVDLTGIPLARLAEFGGSVFAESLRRILQDIDSQQGITAGFQSSI